MLGGVREERGVHRPGTRRRAARQPSHDPRRREADGDRTNERRANGSRPATPAKPRQQRHPVDHDEALHALGLRRGPRQPDRRAPVVQAQPHPVHVQRVE